MKFIIGKKLEMTHKYAQDGAVIPVTKIQAGPCVVTQVKQSKKEGYTGVQVGYGKAKKANKPLAGHLKKLGNFQVLKEFRFQDDKETEGLQPGKEIPCSVFEKGETVSVSGVSKGKGFQGVVKRWGFHGSPASHGHKDQLRMPGSIGATGPAHVFKGQKMPGRMGGEQVTVRNLQVIEVDPKNNIIFVKGAVPGRTGNLVWMTSPQNVEWQNIEKAQEEKKQAADVKEEAKQTEKKDDVKPEDKA